MNFRIYCLTPRLEDNAPYFTADLMTNFNDQVTAFKQKSTQKISENNHSHSYTYDEKFKIDLNSKKSLTFSMSKNVIVDEISLINPFVNNIQVGSLLLLVDYYNNHHFFIVTDIKFNFTSINVTYQYTCEDMFSYTTSRLNSGYTLENDAESEDFIGAKTIDWWVIKHIVPDCRIDYTYVPFNKGLYQRTDNQIVPFTTNQDGIVNINSLKKIIKQPYLDGTLSAEIKSKVDKNEELTVEEQDLYDKYKAAHAYYETFAFSCSDSSANGALVSLADHFDLQIRTFEYLNIKKGKAIFYFWFEPKKNEERVTGLQYSPSDSIQSFSLGHSAKSLTTILDVEGPTYQDELITLIPNVSPFFYQLFQSPVWDKSNFLNNSYSAYLGPQIYQGYIPSTENPEEIQFNINGDNSIQGNFKYQVTSTNNIGTSLEDTIKSDYHNSSDAALAARIAALKTALPNKIIEVFGPTDGEDTPLILSQSIILSLNDLPI